MMKDDLLQALKDIRTIVSKRQLPITDQIFEVADKAIRKAERVCPDCPDDEIQERCS